VASNRASYQLTCVAGGHGAGGVTAAASVTPVARTVTCGSVPPAFTFAGSIASKRAAQVSYYWAFGNGMTGPPGTITFGGAGTKAVPPATFTPPSDTYTGSAVIVTTKPVRTTSAVAQFTLACTAAKVPLKVTAAASVAPASSTVTCGAAPTTFTFSGAITSSAARTVSYHWALSNGTTSPSRDLTFGAAGTQAVQPYAFTPGADSYTGSGAIVVSGPVSAASNTAAFSLSCATPKLAVTLTSSPPSPAKYACGTAAPSFTITGAITASRATSVTYHWARSDGSATGSATVSIGTGQTADVSDHWTPPTSPFNGSDTLDITAPVSVSTPISLAASCTGSHVTSISISAGAPANEDGEGVISYAVTITTDGTGAVTLNWTTSQSATKGPGTADENSGSQTVSGETKYAVDLTGTFYPLYCPDGGNGLPYWVLDATATGTDGQGMSQVSVSDALEGDCDS
jgi:hypothetical protein